MTDILDVYNPDSGKEPWEKLNSETPRAFAAFKTYRDLPGHDRSLAKAVLQLYGEVKPGKLRQFQTWSSRYAWVDRALEWDLEQDRAAREGRIKAIREMNERQARIGQAILQKAVERLRDFEAAELTPELLLRFIQVSTSLERIAMGAPGEITETRTSSLILSAEIDFTTKSDDELREIIRQRLP